MSIATAENMSFISHSEFGNSFLSDVTDGLSGERKTLPAKYFYDDLGSKYFDEICHLEEYYPYKTELALLPAVAKDVNAILTKDIDIIEFGAGSVQKIRPLLINIENIASFIPIDISGQHLQSACDILQVQFPKVRIRPIKGDFTKTIKLPKNKNQNMGFFPGSTIGNFTPKEALEFLVSAKSTLGENSRFLIGVDTKKSPEILHRAYNDNQGVTAKFNLNILDRINRELGSNINTDKFEHYAFYNASEGRIEMHLVSTDYQSFQFGDKNIFLSPGESIHTENSYKYTPDEFQSLAAGAGWACEKTWVTKCNNFSMFLLQA